MNEISLFHYLILALILFLIGIFGIAVSKSFARILLSVEVLITSVCINFGAIAYYCDGTKIEGIAFASFITIALIAQTVIFVALAINIYKHKKIDTIDKLENLKG